jgi:hypothetical protein
MLASIRVTTRAQLQRTVASLSTFPHVGSSSGHRDTKGSALLRSTIGNSSSQYYYRYQGDRKQALNNSLGSSLVKFHLIHTDNKESSDVASSSSRGDRVKGGFKELWSKYGVVGVSTYLGVYVGTLSMLFVAMDFDLFKSSTFGFEPADAIQKVAGIIENVTGSQAFPGYIKENPRMGTFAIAWVMTKFTEPLRLFFTIGIVPSIARTLGYAPKKEKKDKEGEKEEK